MESTQKLREGLNQCTITGVLKEKKLKIDSFIDKQSGKPYQAIAGEIVVKVNEHDEHTVKLFSKQLTKAGAESKLFKAYNTIREEYTSIADIAELPIEQREGRYPTRLTVQGELSINDYYSNNELHSYPEIRGKFINSVTSEDIEDQAEFDAEIYINKIKGELDKDGIETGRVDLEGLTVGYNGIVSPISFKVTGEHGVADHVLSNFQVGDTVSVWGKIINSAIEKVTMKQGMGKAKEEITRTYKNEILIDGGEEFPLTDKAFSPELITKAIGEREIYLAEKKENEEKKANQPKKNVGFGGNKTGNPTPPEKRTPDSIPF